MFMLAVFECSVCWFAWCAVQTPEGQYEVRVRADGGEAAGGGGGGGSGGGGLETRLLSESDTVQTVRSCHSQSTALPL